MEAKYKKRLRGLLKPELFKLCRSKGWFLPGKKSRCPMSRKILIMVLAQTIWCPKCSEVEDVQDICVPRGVRKAELWKELQRLLKLKCTGIGWPETVLARGITNVELTKRIYALKPDHRYFSEANQDGTDESDSDSTS